jgi:hypothetical protein
VLLVACAKLAAPAQSDISEHDREIAVAAASES